MAQQGTAVNLLIQDSNGKLKNIKIKIYLKNFYNKIKRRQHHAIGKIKMLWPPRSKFL